MTQARSFWHTRIGFIFAAAGASIGLGNIWRFPYITGENGGGVFVLLYLLFVLIIGLPLVIGELMIGRHAQRSVVGAYQILGGRSWSWLGWLGLIGNIAVLSFYSVVAGWIMHYTYLSFDGQLYQSNHDEIPQIFNALKSNPLANLLWFSTFLMMTALIVASGIHKGLERLSLILMPSFLFIMIGLLLFVSIDMPGFSQAVDFVFGFHGDKLNSDGIIEALGHALFTLSVGLGGMLTYGSYLKREENIVKNASIIAFFDTLVALLACLLIFPITFSFAMSAEEGPGLVFMQLPLAFLQLPAGNFFMVLFFGLLCFATLTTSIALLEVTVTYLIDEKNLHRTKATCLATGLVLLLGIPAAMAWTDSWLGGELLFNRNWFALVADGVSNIMMPVGGLGVALFITMKLDAKIRLEEFTVGNNSQALYNTWLLVIKFIIPIAITLVFIYKLLL